MKYFFLIFFVFIFFTGSAVALTINSGVVLNTSSSNSSVTFSFDVNVSNFSVNPNSILIYGISFTNSTGTYSCEDINHSTSNLNLDSSQFSCSEGSGGAPQDSNLDSGGSTSYYFYEQPNSLSNFLELKIKMKKDEVRELEVSSNEMGITKITMTSKGYALGDVKISRLDVLPLNCTVPDPEDKIVYQIIQINSTIDNDDLENVSLSMDIDNLWGVQNGVIQIRGIKCLPYLEEVNSFLIQRDENYSSYDFSSGGFSTWVIFGVRESEVQQETDEILGDPDIQEQEGEEEPRLCLSLFSTCWYWWLIPAFIFLIAVFFLTKNKKQRKKHKKRKIIYRPFP